MNCSAVNCRNKPVGTIDRYEDAAYCYPHLMALVTMNENRRPKPKVTFFEDFESPSKLEAISPSPSEMISRTSTFREAEESIRKVEQIQGKSKEPSQIRANDPAVKPKKKNTRYWAAGLIVVLAFGVAAKSNSDNKAHKLAVEELEARNAFAAKCFQIDAEDEAARAGSVGSDAREKAVVVFYEQVLNRECVEFGDGSIFKNPFLNIDSSSPYWSQFMNALQYTAQRWNGIEPFVQRCRDGWISPSIGKRGACSHHGGVVSGFNEHKDSNLADQIDASSLIYPPLTQLIEAVNR